MSFNKICIIGLGLIGGSLSKAIKKNHPNSFIIAIDSNEDSLEIALADKSIDEASSDLTHGIKGADLVFLCTPIHTIIPLMKEIMPLLDDGAIFTDVASIKQNIIQVAEDIHFSDYSKGFFIGGHPMAGTQHSGYPASLPHLFENAYYILTPLDSTPKSVVDSLSNLLSTIGALPLILDGRTHDRIIGAVSHLPHIVAAALVNTVQDVDNSHYLCEKLAAGGFRDITRIASSNPSMWKSISLSNKDDLIDLISHINMYLQNFAKMLADDQEPNIEDFFARAKRYRENLPVRQTLNLLSYYDLYVDVEDRPGIIGEVATILGENSVNIKNLRIINSREGEPGSLVISLPDISSLEKARKVLHRENYKTFNTF